MEEMSKGMMFSFLICRAVFCCQRFHVRKWMSLSCVRNPTIFPKYLSSATLRSRLRVSCGTAKGVPVEPDVV